MNLREKRKKKVDPTVIARQGDKKMREERWIVF